MKLDSVHAGILQAFCRSNKCITNFVNFLHCKFPGMLVLFQLNFANILQVLGVNGTGACMAYLHNTSGVVLL